MKLSATDRHNLQTLIVKNSEFRGTGRAMRKLVDAGLIARNVEGNVYMYETTEAGRKLI